MYYKKSIHNYSEIGQLYTMSIELKYPHSSRNKKDHTPKLVPPNNSKPDPQNLVSQSKEKNESQWKTVFSAG